MGKMPLLRSVAGNGKVDWRFPDSSGFSERTLDCKQLAVNEILKWYGQKEIIRVFLSPFDCRHEGLSLRRSEPELGMGWEIIKAPEISSEEIQSRVQSMFDLHGYCLIYYQAYYFPFSSYYHIYDIVHWALVCDCDDTSVTLADVAGSPAYFNRNLGIIPWELLVNSWREAPEGGGTAVLVRCDDRNKASWRRSFKRLAAESVQHMLYQGGIDQLRSFITEIEQRPLAELTSQLDLLEFDIHYFRRLRELWQLAALRRHVPSSYYCAHWVEELVYLCKSWSLVMGVLMKWKRQPNQDYRYKLVDYLHQTCDSEFRFMREFERMVGKHDAS